MGSSAHVCKFRLGLFSAFLCTASFLITPELLNAQGAAGQAQERAALLRTQAGPTYGPGVSPEGVEQGHAVATPNDKDLGEQEILKRKEEYQPFTFVVAAPFYYTSNVALTRSGEQDDVLFVPGVNFTYQPRITKTLFAEFALVQQFFYYNRFSELNFSSFDAIAGVVYYLPQFHNLTLRARYDYNRLTDTDNFDEFFVNHSFIFSGELPFRFARAQQLSIGVDTEISFYAHPEQPRRNDYSFYVGYQVALSRSFAIDAAARLSVRDYYVGDRTDVSEIFALSANYRIKEWLMLSLLSSVAWNQSNHSVFDYNVANIGAGVALTLKF